MGVQRLKIKLKRIMFIDAGNFFFFQSFVRSFDSSFETESIISPSNVKVPSLFDSFSPYRTKYLKEIFIIFPSFNSSESSSLRSVNSIEVDGFFEIFSDSLSAEILFKLKPIILMRVIKRGCF